VLLDQVLENIISSSEENSPIRRRFKLLKDLSHDVRSALAGPKGYLQVLKDQLHARVPLDLFYTRTATQKFHGEKFHGEKITYEKECNCFDTSSDLLDSFSLGPIRNKLAVGIGLEEAFRNLKGPEATIPKNLTPESIIWLGMSRVRQTLEGSRLRLSEFFEQNKEEGKEAESMTEAVVRERIMGGTEKAISRLNSLTQEFFGPQEPEAKITPGSLPVDHT